MKPFTDRSGEKFHSMQVMHFVKKDKKHRPFYMCKCDCGKTKVVRFDCLVSGNTKSCGCLGLAMSKDRLLSFITKHGQTNTRLYKTWCGMKYRCFSKSTKRKAYSDVSVCSEWMSFEAFQKWALSNGYLDNLTIDRIDPFGDYEPKNCRWVTPEDQQGNKRKTIYVKRNGKKMTLKKFSEETGINYHTLWYRIKAGAVLKNLSRPSRNNSGGKQA